MPASLACYIYSDFVELTHNHMEISEFMKCTAFFWLCGFQGGQSFPVLYILAGVVGISRIRFSSSFFRRPSAPSTSGFVVTFISHIPVILISRYFIIIIIIIIIIINNPYN